jgi:hypothetical protein
MDNRIKQDGPSEEIARTGQKVPLGLYFASDLYVLYHIMVLHLNVDLFDRDDIG